MLSLCKDILSIVCEVLTSSSHTGTSMPQAAGDGCDSKGMELMVQHAHACMPRSCKSYCVKVSGPFINSHGVLRMAGACTLQLLLKAFEGSFTYRGSWSKAWSPAATDIADRDLSCTVKSCCDFTLFPVMFLGINAVQPVLQGSCADTGHAAM